MDINHHTSMDLDLNVHIYDRNAELHSKPESTSNDIEIEPPQYETESC